MRAYQLTRAFHCLHVANSYQLIHDITLLQLNPVPRLFDGAVYEEATDIHPVLHCLQGLEKVT